MRSRGAETLVSEEHHALLMQNASPALADVLFALHESGCRHSEVLSVEAKHFNADHGTWLLTEHKTEGHGKVRLVMLTPALTLLCRRLALKHPTGKLFRNNRAEAWNANSMGLRLWELRKRLGLPTIIAYGYRHTFATQALKNGVPDAHVAALLGHASTTMLHKHYGHLPAYTATLADALKKARA